MYIICGDLYDISRLVFPEVAALPMLGADLQR